ncbi:MAG: spermine synthase [candidate division WOR-3 bacterium]|nr:spermine synthase [candidate division WOR-3 bacterium]MDH5683211.1 spermine synthase [candidate division WOR-3 bacterium]
MNNSFSKSLRFVILVTGASGIIAQIILIRELMVSFYGNELSIGLVLANWLILEALGSFFLGKTIERAKNKIFLLSLVIIIFSLALPVMIYLARIIKNIIGAVPGETLSIPTMFLSSFLILLPLSVTHGALFTFSCNLFSAGTRSEKAVGRVYVLETIGTIAGGVILPYLLIPYFSSFTIVFFIGLINFVALFGLILTTKSTRFSIGLGSLMILFILLIIAKLPAKIQKLSIIHHWQGHNVVYYQNSIYGNIAVIKQQEQYTFFEDGIPVINTPVPDIAFAEDFVHFPLLSHPNPKRVLLISGGAGGILTEILKYRVETIDYVELDPVLLEAVEKFPTPLTIEELSDPRVKLIHQDARSYLNNQNKYYDLILVNFISPATIQINRYFTKEFFALAKQRLHKAGILASIGLGSLSYLSEDLKRMINSNFLTLKSVFPQVRIIPGDFNLFLASTNSEIDLNPKVISERLEERNITTRLITPDYISDRLSEYRIDWFWQSLGEYDRRKIVINSDLAPHGVFYNLIYWSSLSTPGLRKFFNIFQSITVLHFALVLVLISGIILIFVRVGSSHGRRALVIPYALFSTGFVGMVLNLVIILSFQSIYGYVYHQISILVTAFIGGTALGAFISTAGIGKLKKESKFFLLLELALILISPIIYLILFKIGVINDSVQEFIFPVLSLLVGFFVGMEFPLANEIYSRIKERKNVKSVGLLYASDLVGGFLGAIIISIVLIPVLGIFNTCIIAMMFKVSSILLIMLSRL